MLELASDEPVPFTRPMPAEWPELLAFTQEQIDGSEPDEGLSQPAALCLLRRVDELDNNQLINNEYYGLGLAMPGLMHALEDPWLRQSSVTLAAAYTCQKLIEFDAEYREAQGRPVPGWMLTQIIDGRAFDIASYHAIASVTKAELAATDALRALAIARQHGDSLADEIDAHGEDLQKVYGIGEGAITSAGLTNNLLAGPTFVLQRTLESRHSAGSAQCDMPVNALCPADEQLFAGHDVTRFAVNVASLRKDEAVDQIVLCTDVDVRGEVSFARDRLPDTLPPPPPLGSRKDISVIHSERMRCPALNVKGLIELGLELVPAVAVAVQEMLEQQRLQRDQAETAKLLFVELQPGKGSPRLVDLDISS